MRIKELKKVAKREFQNGRWIPEPPGFWDEDDNFPHRISSKCTDEQMLWHRIGWLEAGYLAKGFHLALKDMKYERIVGHFFGEGWKTDIYKDIIVGNFARVEALHRGGKEFHYNGLEVYCGGREQQYREGEYGPEDVIAGAGNCEWPEQASNERTWTAPVGLWRLIALLGGRKVVVDRMHLCPEGYFKQQSLRERAANIARSRYQREILTTFLAWGVDKGWTQFHEHMHFSFIGKPLLIDDINGSYGYERTHNLALSSSEYALVNADNYAAAVHCIGFDLNLKRELLIQIGMLPRNGTLASGGLELKPRGAVNTDTGDNNNHEGGLPGNYTDIDVIKEIVAGGFESFSQYSNDTRPLIPGPPDLSLPNKPGWEWLQFQLHEIQAPDPLPTSL
ncbi:hypothetical protein Dda_1059 [Drechslerella dactyloides]|uniref:Uncharacterized protein n=1 Tax=Drechslerella dactyloides TaxID=74499 RepID=A0AAD6J6B2_DREDA|nr:hypothetical protein Dda_1059 [Drechslerella dactyloides]